MLTTVSSTLSQDQLLILADEVEQKKTPSPWRQWVVRVVLQPFLWAAWFRSKVILREEW
ncbi:MAG: hypothetical protein AAGA46_09370 [Cyanobacteria bacterium P01_F01_bin.13]